MPDLRFEELEELLALEMRIQHGSECGQENQGNCHEGDSQPEIDVILHIHPDVQLYDRHEDEKQKSEYHDGHVGFHFCPPTGHQN